MALKKSTNSILPSKSASKSAHKIAEKNVIAKTAEIREKVKAKQQSIKSKAPKTSTKTAAKSKSRTKAQVSDKNTVTSNRLKLLITIVNRNKAEFYLDLLQSFDVNMQCVLVGRGTADQSMLGLLGLTDSDKSVIISVIQESKVSDALSTIDDKFNTIKGGKGVACTLPVSSVIGALIYRFLSNSRQTVKKEASNGKQ